MESDKNTVEIKIGRFTLCSDGKNWFIYETYMGKDKHKQPKEQTRMAAGFAWSIENLERPRSTRTSHPSRCTYSSI